MFRCDKFQGRGAPFHARWRFGAEVDKLSACIGPLYRGASAPLEIFSWLFLGRDARGSGFGLRTQRRASFHSPQRLHCPAGARVGRSALPTRRRFRSTRRAGVGQAMSECQCPKEFLVRRAQVGRLGNGVAIGESTCHRGHLWTARIWAKF